MGKKSKRSKAPKDKLTPRHHQAIRLARQSGLFLLVEPAGARPEMWRFYDARSTGREVLLYWPDSGGYIVPGGNQGGKLRSDHHAVATARRLAAARVVA